MRIKNQNKYFSKRKPPFYWPFILIVVLLIEMGVLLKERVWSYYYVGKIEILRSQLETLSFENQFIMSNIIKIFDRYLNNSYFVEAQQEFILPKTVLITRIANENQGRE